ncbi:MAG: NAD(P)-dependent alcohol dehydrogenase [Planctomycetota bacterium]
MAVMANNSSSPPSAEPVPSSARMRAAHHERYGSPDGLRVVPVPVPQVGDHDLLVQVRATGLHVGDCFGVRGAPFLMRAVSGWFRPKLGIPGFDVAGVVVAVGAQVTRWQPGDEVFGACDRAGGCAEFVCWHADRFAQKPARLSFAEAAALPTSGLAALHALRDVAQIQPGQRVLINGASGGVGHFAVQIAKAFGADVTGVCSTRNVEIVRELGADQVVDYTREDFTIGSPRFDVIFDNIENRPLAAVRRALAPEGMLILNSGTGATGIKMIIRLLHPLLLSPFVRHKLRRYLSTPSHEDLAVLGGLAEAGSLRPVIANECQLTEVPHALRAIEEGHVCGKAVVVH